jgi:Flp pilus assembly protein TadG
MSKENTRMNPGHRRHHQRGQAMVLLVLSMAVVLGGAAIVIDGGNGMSQQRGTQNASDAAALAGVLVMAQKMGGQTKVDSDVVSAMTSAFTQNATTMQTSYYTDFNKAVVGTVGRGGSIPSNAWGIQANGRRTFNTLLAGAVGVRSWTANATATALAGALRGLCAAADGCGAVPVTYSIPITTCDGSGRPLRVGVDWPIVGLDTAKADQGVGDYESIVPLCKNGPGGVGWLEMGCGGQLADQIETPCNQGFDIPVWLQSSTGNVNGIDDEMNDTWAGKIMLVPMFDSTCRDVPSTGLPADCTDPGSGTNLWYHIPRFAEFLLDHAYISGNNNHECNSEPGQPFIGANGGQSCLKGWFVRYVMQGPVGVYQPCDGTDPNCSEESLFGVQLVK